MPKPKNPALAKLNMEKSIKKNMDSIKESISSKDKLTAKIAFISVIYLYRLGQSDTITSKFAMADKYEEIYDLIKNCDSLEKSITSINDKCKLNLIREDFELLYPKDFLSYTDFDK